MPLVDRRAQQQRPWLRPPRLRSRPAEPGEERHASWLELFFDLVFVVGIAELAQQLVDDHSLGGFAIFAGLFLPVYIAWQGFTFYADRFDTDDVVFRAVMLAGMLATAALSIQVPDVAEGHHTAGFVVAYVALRSLLVGLYLRTWNSAPEARPLVRRYGGGYSVSIVIWLASLLVDEPARYVLWGVGLALEYAMPPLAVPLHRRIPVDTSHVPDRFALFTIIALGESIVAVALGTADSDWQLASAVTAALGFVCVACMWWVYFDQGVGFHLHLGAGAILRFAYVHIPLLAALTAVGAGVHLLIEEVAHHFDHADAGAAWALDGGLALYLLCLTVVQGATARGERPAVHEAVVPEELRRPGVGIRELPSAVEGLVLDDQRDVQRDVAGGVRVRDAARIQHRRYVADAGRRIRQQIAAGQARVHVRARDPQRVVVVPEQRSALLVGVRHRLRAPRRHLRLPARVRVERVAVLAVVDARAVHVRVDAGINGTRRHQRRVGREQRHRRQLIAVGHVHRVAALRNDRWAQVRGTVWRRAGGLLIAPDRGRADVGMNADAELLQVQRRGTARPQVYDRPRPARGGAGGAELPQCASLRELGTGQQAAWRNQNRTAPDCTPLQELSSREHVALRSCCEIQNGRKPKAVGGRATVVA